MNLPSPPVLRPEEHPESEPSLLQAISVGFRDLYQALAPVPDRSVRSGSFTSAASGVTTVLIQNPLTTKPRHLTLALRRDDLADFSAAWSWWFVVQKSGIALKFVGLPASTRHAYSVEFF